MRKILLFCLLLYSSLLQAAEFPPPHDALGFSNYQVKSFSSSTEGTLQYTQDKQKQRIKWHGSKWDLRRTDYADNATRDTDAKLMIAQWQNLGGETLYQDEESYYGKLQTEQATSYVELLLGWKKQIRLYLYQQEHFVPNKPRIIEFNADTPKEQLFSTEFDGEHYYVLKAEVLEGEGIKIEAKTALEHAKPNIKHKTSLDINSKYYQHYAMYDLDTYAGTHTFAITRTKNNKTPSKVKVTLEKTPYSVPALGELSEQAGLFTLKNSLSSLPALESIGYVGGDYKPQGDFLPNGDAIYWLNNAYYHFEKDGLRTNLISVRSDHQTTVEWPLYFAEMQAAQSTDDEQKVSTKMAIYEVRAKGNKEVEVDLSLSHLPRGMELSPEDFSALEGGSISGTISKVERLHEPMNVVILLDSSGSMKKDMKLALKAVESFIEKLPEDAQITLVDFDTKVKPVQAKSRQELLAKLRKIKPNGATALYDSVIKARELLQDKSRASVVLFTDGKDANHNDTKRGSKATFDEMIQSIQTTRLPIYPIAFGDNADVTSLQTLAQMTKTTYYQGDTEEKLNAIFDDIAHNLSSAFRVTFSRGKASQTGSQPVVNYMVDVSGSMDVRYTMRKKCEGCSYRFEPLKSMLASSVAALPDDTFIQLNTFSNEFKTQQILTQDKAKVLAGIGNIKIGGGTDIVGAVKRSLALSQLIPSQRRYLIFATDAAGDAFEFDEEQQKELNAALLDLNKAGIQTFWIGMWESEATQQNMQKLAELSGGEAFVSSDIEQIRDKISQVTQQINAGENTVADYHTLSMKLKKRNPATGELLVAVGQKDTDLTAPQTTTGATVQDIAYKVEPFNVDKQSYNAQYAQTIYGDDKPLKDVRLQKMLPLLDDQQQPISASNEAMQLSLSKGYIFDRLKGINAGHKYRYLVLDVAMQNILPEQEVVVLDDGSKHPSSWLGKSNASYKTAKAIPTYQIPNLKNHLFIRVNNQYELPFNPITWALAKPLTEVDDYQVSIAGESSREGVLAFKIPNEPIQSLSLHYYDSAYGHIDLPVIGTMQVSKHEIESLPQQAPLKLSDAFSLSVEERLFTDELVGNTAPEDSVFAVLHLNLHSQVNALLQLEPHKRFYLQIQTPQGDWTLKPHPLSAQIPFGLYDKLSLAPASHNRLAVVFQIPKALQDQPQQLLVELKGADKRIPLGENTTPSRTDQALATAQGDNIKLSINSIHKLKRIDGKNRERLLIDVSLSDTEDLSASRLHNFLYLANTATPNLQGRAAAQVGNAATSKGLGGFANSSAETENSKTFIGANTATNSRVLGCRKLVLDGNQQRCTLLFDPTQLQHDGKLYLVSGIFSELQYAFKLKKIKQLPEEKHYLVSKVLEVDSSDDLEDLQRLLSKVRQQKRQQAQTTQTKQKLYALDDATEQAQHIDPLPVSYYGAQQIANISDEKQAIAALEQLQWVPSYHGDRLFSAATMFTQGWGTQYEMADFLLGILKQKDIPITLGYYSLTEAGKAELQQRAKGMPGEKVERAYFLRWEENGSSEEIVFPFLAEPDAVSQWIQTDKSYDNASLGQQTASMEIKLFYEADKSHTNVQMGGIGAALSGGDVPKAKQLKLLKQSYHLHRVSNMPLDVWFALTQDKNGKDILRTYVYSVEGVEEYDTALPNKIVPSRLSIQLHNGDHNLDPYSFNFKDGQDVEDVFFTFAFAAPNLSPQALEVMDQENSARLQNVQTMSEFSQLQWMNRLKLYKFLGVQSRHEQHLSDTLKVQAKRVRNPRVLMAMVEKTPQQQLISSLDLRYAHADVYGDTEAVHSFNIMAGLFAAQAEATVTPQGQGVFDYWNNIEQLSFIHPDMKQEVIEHMQANGTDAAIITRLQASDKVWLYPLQATATPAWLEIDPETYQTVSVLANGQYGAMTEETITRVLINDGSQFIFGFLSGIQTSLITNVTVSMFVEGYDNILNLSEGIANLIACGVATIESGVKLKKVLKDPLSSTGAKVSGITDGALAAAGCVNGNAAMSLDAARNMSVSLAGHKPKSATAAGGLKAFLGFGNGFSKGVEYYFKTARAAGASK